MSDAVGFLVIPVLAAVAGSLVIWLVSRSRRPPEPEFGDQLRVGSRRARSAAPSADRYRHTRRSTE